jgi:predicted PurR-regulated permease PerM
VGPSPERPLLPANRELVRGLGVVTAFLVVAYLVILARHHALLEIFLAVALAAILEPLVRVLQRRLHLRRGYAAAIAVGGVVAALTAIVALVIAPFYTKIRDLIDALPSVARQLRENGSLGDLDHGKEVSQALEDAANWLVAHLPQAAESLLGVIGAAVGTGFTAFTILFMAFFLLLEGARIERWSRGYIDPIVQARVERVGGEITRLTGNYVAGALAIALIAATVMYVAMRIGDVPYAAGLAVLVFVLDLVPMVGATIAACVVILVALTVSTGTAVAMGIVALVYQQIENNITQPLVQRKTVSLSPFLVMASVIVGSALLGVLGALLAVPGAAAMKVIAQEFLSLPGYVEPPAEPEAEST